MSSTKSSTEIKSTLDFNKTFADRFGTAIAAGFGSITFLIGCILSFVIWALWNIGLIPGLRPFDPFPFPILDMVVSLVAIMLSVSVLINQNRQGKIDKLQQQVEFEVNVRAEEEITKMLSMLHKIQQHLGIKNEDDAELEKMKETTDIHEIHKTIDD